MIWKRSRSSSFIEQETVVCVCHGLPKTLKLEKTLLVSGGGSICPMTRKQ